MYQQAETEAFMSTIHQSSFRTCLYEAAPKRGLGPNYRGNSADEFCLSKQNQTTMIRTM